MPRYNLKEGTVITTTFDNNGTVVQVKTKTSSMSERCRTPEEAERLVQSMKSKHSREYEISLN